MTGEPLRVVVDTDLGVDDAAAIAWLVSQTRYPVQVLGFGVVAGNTTLAHATNNLLTILDALGRRDLPVVRGAAAPLTGAAARLGGSVHGPDGLWGIGLQHPHDLSALPQDVPAFYRDLAEAHPGATLIALGPLTNVAQALARYPEAMRRYARLVILGGAWRGGNITPVAEFNVWYDAEAAAQVLASGLPITLVTLDAFQQFSLEAAEVAALEEQGTPVARLLAPALRDYLGFQRALGRPAAAVPDMAAVMVAVDSRVGPGRSGLVRVVTDTDLALGQTVIAFEPYHRLMVALPPADRRGLMARAAREPGVDVLALAAEMAAGLPDNAQVTLTVDAARMRALFLEALTTPA